MLLQNAQMHQVIMQNLMLQAVPPTAPVSSRGPQATPLQPTRQVGSAWSRHQAKEATQINTRGPGQLLFWKLCISVTLKSTFLALRACDPAVKSSSSPVPLDEEWIV